MAGVGGASLLLGVGFGAVRADQGGVEMFDPLGPHFLTDLAM